jgi:hypothetical protein
MICPRTQNNLLSFLFLLKYSRKDFCLLVHLSGFQRFPTPPHHCPGSGPGWQGLVYLRSTGGLYEGWMLPWIDRGSCYHCWPRGLLKQPASHTCARTHASTHTRKRTHTHTHSHKHKCTHVHTRMHTYRLALTDTYPHTHTHRHTHTRTHTGQTEKANRGAVKRRRWMDSIMDRGLGLLWGCIM